MHVNVYCCWCVCRAVITHARAWQVGSSQTSLTTSSVSSLGRLFSRCTLHKRRFSTFKGSSRERRCTQTTIGTVTWSRDDAAYPLRHIAPRTYWKHRYERRFSVEVSLASSITLACYWEWLGRRTQLRCSMNLYCFWSVFSIAYTFMRESSQPEWQACSCIGNRRNLAQGVWTSSYQWRSHLRYDFTQQNPQKPLRLFVRACKCIMPSAKAFASSNVCTYVYTVACVLTFHPRLSLSSEWT